MGLPSRRFSWPRQKWSWPPYRAPYCADPGCLSRIPDPTYSIPDPNFFHPGSRIHIKEFKYFNPKNCILSSRKYDPGCSSRIRILVFLPIPDPGSRDQNGTGSRIRIRNTVRHPGCAYLDVDFLGPGSCGPDLHTVLLVGEIFRTPLTILFHHRHLTQESQLLHLTALSGSGGSIPLSIVQQATRSVDDPLNLRQKTTWLEVRRNFFSNRVI